MELKDYINCSVHIELHNGFFYIGRVLSADDDFIEIFDRTNKKVSISKQSIASLKEVDK